MFILLQDNNICVSLVQIYLLISILTLDPFCVFVCVCVFRKKNKRQNAIRPILGGWWNVTTSHWTARCCRRRTTMLSLLLRRSETNSQDFVPENRPIFFPKKDMNHLNQPSIFRVFAVSFTEGRSKWDFVVLSLESKKSKKMPVLGRFSLVLLGELNE